LWVVQSVFRNEKKMTALDSTAQVTACEARDQYFEVLSADRKANTVVLSVPNAKDVEYPLDGVSARLHTASALLCSALR
jgi:hypothetical protein